MEKNTNIIGMTYNKIRVNSHRETNYYMCGALFVFSAAAFFFLTAPKRLIAVQNFVSKKSRTRFPRKQVQANNIAHLWTADWLNTSIRSLPSHTKLSRQIIFICFFFLNNDNFFTKNNIRDFIYTYLRALVYILKDIL